MTKKLLLAHFLFCIYGLNSVFAQGDDCSTAQYIGTLPTPAACPSGNGTTVSVAGTNIGATSPNPYTYLLGCQPAGNQAAPALDVWYSFTATGNLVNINISGTLATPNVAMWSGTCGSLVGFDCAIGNAAGNLTATFQPTTPGQTYYLQISGNTPTGSGNFTLTLDNDNDCNNCMQASSLTASPLPTNGTYLPGTTVTFCFTVSSFTQISSNWLHGITPTFGCGWNTATLAPVGNPTECSASGTWGWYPSNTSSATGAVTGAGWYYNYAVPADANPGNNYGDYNSSGTCTWTFCWSIQTAATCACPNLNMTINALGDGESGSWSSIACQLDPDYQFSAVLTCCLPPVMTQTNVLCNGQCTGTATATAQGTDSPWDYVWTGPFGPVLTQNNISTPSTATGLCAGTYTVTVTDNNNCVSFATVTITQPAVLTAAMSSTPASCGSSTGSASVTAGGGTPAYTYAWSPSGGNSSSATGLSAGNYTVTITDGNGCTATGTVTVASTASGTANISSSANVTCNGANNGNATATMTGGTPNYTYAWNNGQTTSTATSLPPGNYTCTITDANGCTATTTVSITQPAALSASVTTTNSICTASNGTASVSASGGTGAYTYLWNPSGQTSPTATGLSSGTYSVTVTDANGCTFVLSATVNSTGGGTASILSSNNVLCNGGNTGNATATMTGGTPNYTFVWSNGQTTSVATGLSFGNYTVTVTDANGCSSVTTVSISQPTALSAVPSQTNVTCNGGNTGSASVNMSGGTPAYTYAWNPSGGNSSSATGLSAGNYSVTVTDANGCTSVSAFTITQPTAVTAVPSSTNVSCNGGSNGSASVTAGGGAGGYSYLWSNSQTTSSATGLIAGNYSVTVTDASGCTSSAAVVISQPTAITATTSSVNEICNQLNGSATVSPSGGTGAFTYLWSNGQATSTATGLAAATYSVTVTDANGCTYSTTVTVNSTGGPIANAGPNASVCFGASTTLSVTGGGTYAWVPAAGLNCTTCSNPVATPNASTTYTVVVTDVNGCFASANVTVTVNALPVPNAGADVSICSGTSAQLNASGGGTYLWSPANGLSSTNISNPVASPASTTTYSLTVTDANGCSNSDAVMVTINALPVVAFVAPNECFNTQTSFTDQSTGSTSWLWNFGEPSSGPNDTSSIQNPNHTYSNAGTFTVTLVATNQFGCVDSLKKVVIVNPLPQASFTASTVCIGNTTLFADQSSVSPGSLINWNWNFADPNSGASNISTLQNPSHTYTAAGTFNVVLTVTSDSGCQSTIQIPVNVLALPIAAFSFQNICENYPAQFNNNSTAPPLTWTWTFGDGNSSTQQSPSHTYVGFGTYTVTLIATTSGGCADTVSDTIVIYPNPVPDFIADSVCIGFTNSFSDLSMIPQGSITNWNWAFGDGNTDTVQNPTHIYSSSGTYTATLSLTSNNGCTTAISHSVFVYAQPTADFSVSPNSITELGELFAFSDLSYTGIVQWAWTFGDGDSSSVQNPGHSYADTGMYNVTLIVISQFGCIDTVMHFVEVRDFAFYVPNAFTPNGDNHNDLFSGVGIGIREYELLIFDRWGNLIFITHDYNERWDGTIKGGSAVVQEDVYVWKIRVLDIFNKEHRYIGTVTKMK
ncbi:MAG: PKD domain-containing protein [Bacteroidetes bacterium]|nr:PKD domain-containing protein [Bacteroidota bacterium]